MSPFSSAQISSALALEDCLILIGTSFPSKETDPSSAENAFPGHAETQHPHEMHSGPMPFDGDASTGQDPSARQVPQCRHLDMSAEILSSVPCHTEE